MKKIIALLGCALALGAPAASARGAEPGKPSSAGRVLILDNEKTMTGDIEPVGDQYRVKRLVGETWVPAARVLKLCATLEDAHRYMQSRANLDDPDERLRLADWCVEHGLRDQALGEARAAAVLKPNDPAIKRMLSYLELVKAQASQPRTAATERPVPRVDVTAESLGMFASKVQPILMNACVSCHNSGRSGTFQLTRISGPAMSNRRSLDQNLAAVVAQISASEPGSSRLLLKAVSIHGPGMTQAPLKNRQAPAYQTLEAWVRMTAETNPHLRERAVAATAPPPAPEPKSNGWGQDRGAAAMKPAETKPPEQPKPAEPMKPPEAKEKPAAPKPLSNEPGDPDVFNRAFHPERKE